MALQKSLLEHDAVCRGVLIGALLWRARAGRRFHAKPVREISHPRDEPGGDSEQTNGGAVAAFRSTGAAELRSEPLRASTAASQRRPRAVSVRRQNYFDRPPSGPGCPTRWRSPASGRPRPIGGCNARLDGARGPWSKLRRHIGADEGNLAPINKPDSSSRNDVKRSLVEKPCEHVCFERAVRHDMFYE